VSTGMGDTPNRRTASAAAREFLQTKIDRVGDLAEAARAIDAAVEARAAADRHITDCQQAYSATRCAAIAVGWTDDELEQLGWAAERAPQPQRRRRPAASAQWPQRPAAAAPEARPPSRHRAWAIPTRSPSAKARAPAGERGHEHRFR